MRTRVLRRSGRVCAASAIAIAAVSVASPVAQANEIIGTRNWQIVSRLTGPNITGNVSVGGTDLGHMVNHNGKTYFLFGDTFSNEASEGLNGQNWRNNVMAYTTDRNPADGITFDGWITDSAGRAKQVIIPGNSPTTYIPTGAISVNNKIYAWYMHVSNWGGWTLDHAGLASWSEGQSTFTTVPNYQFKAPTGNIYTTDEGRGDRGNFGMVAASQRSPLENSGDNNVYLWGTPGGRYGGVKLARVAPNQIENLGAYQYFNGTVNGVPQWTNNEYDADRIIQNNVGEMSVMYNEALEAWTLMYFNGANNRMEIRSSKTPWGKWSDPTTVVTPQQAPGLYAPFMNPLYVENGGKTLYFTMSLWNPYDVYMAKVDLDIDMQTRWTATTGNWTTASAWDYGTPVAGDRVFIDNGGSVLLTTTANVRNFDTGSAAGMNGNLSLSPGAALTINDGGFRLGQAAGGRGSLNMTGGSINITGGYDMFLVGDNGEGTATITGGSVTARTFGVALQPTSTGTLTVGGNAVITTTGDRFVLAMIRNAATGQRPTASMTMTGGTINVNAGASGIPDAVIGFDGVASLNMSGGTFNVAGLFVSAVSGASGVTARSQATIEQSGGTINADRVLISESGLSSYALSNSGAINSNRRITLGGRAGSEATFHQTGGSINADRLSLDPSGISFNIGESGRGIYTIDGGTLTTTRRLVAGEISGSVGQMNVNGGTITVGTELTIGVAGNATMTITGGNVSAGTGVRVGSNGAFTYVGGSLSTPSLTIAGRGKFLFTAGGDKGLALNTLSIDVAGGGMLDLADNRLVVNGDAATLSAITALIAAGFHGGDWAGAGINSSVAANNSFAGLGIAPAAQLTAVPTIFGNVSDSAILVRYTLKGDTDLSGGVDFADLVALAQNYNAATGKLWFQGDSNYDGQVNFSDLVSLAQNYGKGVMTAGTQLDLLNADFVGDWTLAQSLVPEPTALCGVGAAIAAVGRRRRPAGR